MHKEILYLANETVFVLTPKCFQKLLLNGAHLFCYLIFIAVLIRTKSDLFQEVFPLGPAVLYIDGRLT